MSTTRSPVFVESVDVDRAWEVYYRLAQRRWKKGLTREQLAEVIEAALVGVVEAEKKFGYWGTNDEGEEYHKHRFVSPWVEVEEHQ